MVSRLLSHLGRPMFRAMFDFLKSGQHSTRLEIWELGSPPILVKMIWEILWESFHPEKIVLQSLLPVVLGNRVFGALGPGKSANFIEEWNVRLSNSPGCVQMKRVLLELILLLLISKYIVILKSDYIWFITLSTSDSAKVDSKKYGKWHRTGIWTRKKKASFFNVEQMRILGSSWFFFLKRSVLQRSPLLSVRDAFGELSRSKNPCINTENVWYMLLTRSPQNLHVWRCLW